MLPITTQEIKFRKMPLYVIAAILVLFGYILIDTGKLNDTANLVAGGIVLAILLLFYFSSKLNLVIDNDGITQERFFGKVMELPWTNIKTSSLAWHFHGHGANLLWEFTCYEGKNFSITPTYYSRKDVRLLAEAVVLKCKQAVIDKRIINMANGKFPWYIF
jgi:hypothetical protein